MYLPKLNWRTCAAVFALLLTASLAGRVAQGTIVRFSSALGNVDVRLYNQATPLSVANFLGYVGRGDYQGTMIHRSASDGSNNPFVIQGGAWKYDSTSREEPQDFPVIPVQPAVMNEPGISNIRGTLAYAKTSDPNSATDQWYFNLENNSFLDSPSNGAFTVFGRVVGSGMSVADAIAALPTFAFQGAWNEAPMRNYTAAQFNAFVPVGGDNVVSMNIDVLNLPKGDYNFDGQVNSADYTVWKNSYGSTTAAEADGNGDGKVDDADYTIWRDTLGQTSGPGSGAAAGVPEPRSLLLMFLVAPVLWMAARTKCGSRASLTFEAVPHRGRGIRYFGGG
jgi:cyclophilin family peptidyl-prolyl cis-trans isomerase